jgi:hypothetical protein
MAALGAACLLSGCNNADRERADREALGVMTARTDGTLPSNLPPFLAVFPGARVTSTVDGGSRGGTVSFRSPATSDQVVSFYRQRAAAAGLTPKTDVASNAVRILMFDDAPGGHRSFVLNLTQTAQGVQAALTYGPQG